MELELAGFQWACAGGTALGNDVTSLTCTFLPCKVGTSMR